MKRQIEQCGQWRIRLMHQSIWTSMMCLCCCLLIVVPSLGQERVAGSDRSRSLPDITKEWQEILAKGDEPSVQERKRELYIEIMRRAAIGQNRDFHIAGVVVDEEGRPLKGVTLAAGGYRSTGWDQTESKDNFVREIDHTFEFEITDVHFVSMGVTKEGYYPAGIRIDDPGEKDVSRHLLSGKLPPKGKVERLDMRMVMEKKGELTRLDSYWGKAQFSSNGQTTPLLIEKSKADEAAPDVANVAAITMRAELAPDGTIAVSDELRVPVRVTLTVSGKDAGLQLYTLPEGEYWTSTLIKRRMKLAPLEGYQREIVLDSNALLSGRIRFYVKANGKYGRGGVIGSSPGASKTLDVLEVTLDVQMQPDGSRNLETGE